MITIQLFSDGGVFSKGKVAISVGRMYINRNKILTCEKINFNKGSDFAELFAINKILSRAYGYCKQKDILNKEYQIEIFTDSQSSISSILSESITDGIELRNQLICEIKDTITKFDNRVVFYHIKSHISGCNLKSSYKMFCIKNDVDIPFDDFLFIYQQNKKCNNTVAREHKKYHKKKKIEEKQKLVLSKEINKSM